MTRFKSQKKSSKLSKIKHKQLKYEYLHGTNELECNMYPQRIKQRVPSKQQYKRKKTSSIISNEEDCKTIIIKSKPIYDISLSIDSNQLSFKEDRETVTLDRILKRHSISESSYSTPPLSAKSFQIHADWSEFEDKEHFQFVSEQDIDLSNVMNKLFDFKVVTDETKLMDEEEDIEVESTIYNYDNTLQWINETSSEKLNNIPLIIDNLTKKLQMVVQHCFECNLNLEDLQLVMDEFNSLYKQTEMLAYLTKELNLPEETKWEHLLCKMGGISKIIDCLNDIGRSKHYFDVNLRIMFHQIKELLQSSTGSSQDTISHILNGIKEIINKLRVEFTKLQSLIDELFDEQMAFPVQFLDLIDNKLDGIKAEYNDKNVIELLKLLATYLKIEVASLGQLEQHLLSNQEPQPLSFNQLLMNLTQSKIMMHFPLKLVFMFFMSFMCLFSNCDIGNNTNQHTSSSMANNNFSSGSTTINDQQSQFITMSQINQLFSSINK